MVEVDKAIDIISEAGSRFWRITGNGNFIKFEDADDGEPTTEAAVEKLIANFERLAPGMYELTHWKNLNGVRNPAKIRVIKRPQHQNSDMNGPAFYGPDPALMEQMNAMKEELIKMAHRREIEELQHQHNEEVRRLKRQMEEKNEAGEMMNLVKEFLLKKAPAAKQAGQPAGMSGPAAATEETQEIGNLLQRLHAQFGDDAEFIGALRKLAEFAENNPTKFKTYLAMM